MNLSQLSKTTKRSKKKVGRGYGSGKGHQSGRGTKGQNARSGVALEFQGAARGAGFYKRLPLLRGKGKLKPNQQKPYGVNVKYLNVLPKNSEVTLESLMKHGIVNVQAKKTGVKILGDGELTVALTVMLPVSGGAQKKIEKAGGTVGKQEKKIQRSKELKDSKKVVKLKKQ